MKKKNLFSFFIYLFISVSAVGLFVEFLGLILNNNILVYIGTFLSVFFGFVWFFCCVAFDCLYNKKECIDDKE